MPNQTVPFLLLFMIALGLTVLVGLLSGILVWIFSNIALKSSVRARKSLRETAQVLHLGAGFWVSLALVVFVVFGGLALKSWFWVTETVNNDAAGWDETWQYQFAHFLQRLPGTVPYGDHCVPVSFIFAATLGIALGIYAGFRFGKNTAARSLVITSGLVGAKGH